MEKKVVQALKQIIQVTGTVLRIVSALLQIAGIIAALWQSSISVGDLAKLTVDRAVMNSAPFRSRHGIVRAQSRS